MAKQGGAGLGKGQAVPRMCHVKVTDLLTALSAVPKALSCPHSPAAGFTVPVSQTGRLRPERMTKENSASVARLDLSPAVCLGHLAGCCSQLCW